MDANTKTPAAETWNRVDGSKVRLFPSKRLAQTGAREIGWPVKCVTVVQTRFCEAWALCTGVSVDAVTGLPYVSREEYGRMWHDRNGG